jgi:hypothetical protein
MSGELREHFVRGGAGASTHGFEVLDQYLVGALDGIWAAECSVGTHEFLVDDFIEVVDFSCALQPGEGPFRGL